MSWEAVTAISSAITGLVIVVTAYAGIDQLRQLRAQRRDTAAVELMRSLQDGEFSRAFSLVLGLPAGISAGDLHVLGKDYLEAVQLLSLRCEMLGVLVYRGAVDFEVAEDLCGGGIVSIWKRAKNYAIDIRVTQQYPMYLEWFQWAAEQYEKRERLTQVPAHDRHREWRPPSR